MTKHVIDDGRVVRSDIALQDVRTARHFPTIHLNIVFNRNRNASTALTDRFTCKLFNVRTQLFFRFNRFF